MVCLLSVGCGVNAKAKQKKCVFLVTCLLKLG